MERSRLQHTVATMWLSILGGAAIFSWIFFATLDRSLAGQAVGLMLKVHTEGRAIVATGNREAMERHVEAMHGYGLQATVSRADP